MWVSRKKWQTLEAERDEWRSVALEDAAEIGILRLQAEKLARTVEEALFSEESYEAECKKENKKLVMWMKELQEENREQGEDLIRQLKEISSLRKENEELLGLLKAEGWS